MTSEGRTEGTGEATTHIGNSNPKSIQLIEAFVGPHADYYVFQFGRISQLGLAGIRLNWAATLGGPFWAATRSLWMIFGFAALGDVIGLIMISRAYWSSSQGNGVLIPRSSLPGRFSCRNRPRGQRGILAGLHALEKPSPSSTWHQLEGRARRVGTGARNLSADRLPFQCPTGR